MELRDMTTYDRILTAAARLFAEKGYEGTTTREIVEAAGASLSSFHQYFQSKEGIYKESVNRAMIQYQKLLKPELDAIDILDRQGMLHGGAAWDLLVELISKHSEWVFMEEYHDAILLINREMLEVNPLIARVPDSALISMNGIQRLCEAYVGVKDTTWGKLVGHSLLMTLFGVANYPRILSQLVGKDLSVPENAQEIRLLVKDYLLTTVRAYLNVRKQDVAAENAK